MSSQSNSQPVLCIPGVFSNIKEERIRRVFGDLDLGEVDHIDIVLPKRSILADEKENKFNRVFVHINWNQTPQSIACRQKLLQGKEVKIIYDAPWFWKVSAYRPPAPKKSFQSQQPQQKKATIQFDFDPDIKIAPALSISFPVEIKENPIIEAKSPKCPPPKQKKTPKQYGEFGEEIKEEVIDYGKVEPPRRKKVVIKLEEDTVIVAEK